MIELGQSNLNSLSKIVTGRERSYFLKDIDENFDEIKEFVHDKKILIFGSSGFIANQTVLKLIEYKPKALILIDINENSLTESIRQIRNKFELSNLPKIYPILSDVSFKEINLISKLHNDTDIILNFSAVKHVRSERDPLSLSRMFKVNVLSMFYMIELTKNLPNLKSFFSVSTDKAANPVNFMGASKKLMEVILFSSLPNIACSSRFANVSFSTGSLLESWIKRIAEGEPVACPLDTKRYFISPEESGDFCLLSSTIINKGFISIPNLNPNHNLQKLDTVLFNILNYLELEPEVFDNEQIALLNSKKLAKEGKQAVLLTRLDTSGEKSFEEFKTEKESPIYFSSTIELIQGEVISIQELQIFKDKLDIVTAGDKLVSKNIYYELIGTLVKNFQHIDTINSLDDRL